MIDLHSHTLPGLCDGSPDLETSLQMAKMAAADGITHLACTPHVYPNIYNNSTYTIQPALLQLQAEIDKYEIPLKLIIGADTHMLPEVLSRLKDGSIPTLNNSRYFLLEPAHHVPVVGFLDHISGFLSAGYVPLITHPERLSWIKPHYDEFIEAAKMGAWIQLTAGAITGNFGKTAKNYAHKFLEDGYTHVVASDAHGTNRRPPLLSPAVEILTNMLGEEEAKHCVQTRPQAVIDNITPNKVVSAPAFTLQPEKKKHKTTSWFKRIWN